MGIAFSGVSPREVEGGKKIRTLEYTDCYVAKSDGCMHITMHTQHNNYGEAPIIGTALPPQHHHSLNTYATHLLLYSIA
jgi:hypothetical protein